MTPVEAKTCGVEIEKLTSTSEFTEKQKAIQDIKTEDLKQLQSELLSQKTGTDLKNLNNVLMNDFTKASKENFSKTTDFSSYEKILLRPENIESKKALDTYFTNVISKIKTDAVKDSIYLGKLNKMSTARLIAAIKKENPGSYAIALAQSLTIACCGQGEALENSFNKTTKKVDAKYGMNTLMAIKSVLPDFNGVITQDVLNNLAKKVPVAQKSPEAVVTAKKAEGKKEVKKDVKPTETINAPIENPFKEYTFTGPDGKIILPTDNKDGTISLNIGGTDVLITTKEGIPTLKIWNEIFNLYVYKNVKEIRLGYDSVSIKDNMIAYKAINLSLDGAAAKKYTGAFDFSKKEQIDVHLSAKDQPEIIVALSNTGELQTKEIKIDNIDYSITYNKLKKELTLTKKEVIE